MTPQQASCSYTHRTISYCYNSKIQHQFSREYGILELSGSQHPTSGCGVVRRDRRRRTTVVHASNGGDNDQRVVENVDRSYCDDFVCTSSPSVELTVKALAKDIERGNGVWTKSLMAKGVEYKDAWCSTNGIDEFQVDFIPKYCTPTEDVRVTRMRMVDQATACLEWSVVGITKGMGPLSGTPVAVDMMTTIEMNLLTGQIERREDSWKMASRSSVRGQLAWTLARAVWGSLVQSRMARKTSANLIEKSIDSVMGSLDDDEDAMSSYQADPNDPMKFFQQNDSFKDDAIALCIFLLVMYIIITGMMTSPTPRLLAFKLVLTAAALCHASTDIAQFGGTVFLGGEWDWLPNIDGEGTKSRCEQGLDRLASHGMSRVQFAVTFFWDDIGPLNPPEGFDYSCTNADLSSYYCYNRFNSTEVSHWCFQRPPFDQLPLDARSMGCTEVTTDEIDSFKYHVGSCLQKAVEMGFEDLEVNVRVDDGKSLEGWRNTLLFSPTEEYGQFSYETAILNTIADTLVESVQSSDDVQVAFTLQGEMGATIFFFAEEWIGVMERLRERIDSQRSAGSPPVKLGIHQNNAKLCGCFQVGFEGSHEEYIAMLGDMDTSLMDLESVKQLYALADYLGISAYIPMKSATFALCDFEGLLERTDIELSYFNLSLQEIVGPFETRLHYSEFGVGGGSSNSGNTPAVTATQAARYPYYGIHGKHACENDPFRMCECDATGACRTENPVREYRRYYYDQFSTYLTQGGCRYDNIEVVYVWGTGSWDVLGAYPPDRSWEDPVVIERIRQHNQNATRQMEAPVE